MPAISQCPKCDAEVSLPQGADPQWRVRCPVCSEEFLLQAALELAPPELIVLDRVQAEVCAADEEVETEAPTEQAVAFDFGTDQVDTEVTFPGNLVRDPEGETSVCAARQQPRLGRPLVVRQIVGVLLGGVLGLAIGYLVLLWIGGPRKDFLQLGERLPAFLLPSSFHPSQDILEFPDSLP